MSGSTSYQINWNKFQSNIAGYMQSMLAKDFLTDVSLYSGNQTWKVHKVVLCANSGYFEQLLRGLSNQLNPVFVLDHIHPEFISYLLEYMYTGNINIEQDKVHQFIQVSKVLQIRGISTNKEQDWLNNQDQQSQEENKREHLEKDGRSHKSVTRKRRSSDRVKSGKQGCQTASSVSNQTSAEIDNKMETESEGDKNKGADHSNMQHFSEEAESVVVKSEPFVEVGLMDKSSTVQDPGGKSVEIKQELDDPDNQETQENLDYMEQDSTKRSICDTEDYTSSKTSQESNILLDRRGDEEWSGGTGSLSVRSDLLPTNTLSSTNQKRIRLSAGVTGNSSQNSMKSLADIDRCHFCSLHCGSQEALTSHLKSVHMPPKHALCENCENFFHVCAIVRHKAKCQVIYQTESSNT